MKKIFSLLLFLLCACQPGLNHQLKEKQWADNRLAPAGTIPVPEQVKKRTSLDELQYGKSRYEIYCGICHGGDGSGNALLSQHGFGTIPSLQETKTKALQEDALLQIVQNGQGKMFGFRDRLSKADMLAILAYLRVLQWSQNTSLAELPARDQKILEQIP